MHTGWIQYSDVKGELFESAWNENYDLNISLNEFESNAYGGPRDLPRMNRWIGVTRDMSSSGHQKTARRTGSPVRLIGIRKKGGTIV